MGGSGDLPPVLFDSVMGSRRGSDDARVHPVDRFRQTLDQLERYPRGVVKIPQPVDGTAFFAAGPGLYCDQPPSIAGFPPFPVGKTVFVGNNLDADGPYRERLASGVAHGDRCHPMRTWRGLYQLLDAAELDPHDCFFTNAYVGLVEGDKPTGRFPGASDPGFSAWCEDFLRLQIVTMKPAVLATIGADAATFRLARLTPDLAEWKHGSSQAVHNAEIDGHSLAAGRARPPVHVPSERAQPTVSRRAWRRGRRGVAARRRCDGCAR